MDNPIAWIESLPPVTKLWFGAALAVNAATTMDVLSVDQLLFDWHRIYHDLELWRIASCFLYGGGPLNEFHVLILLYMIYIHSAGYERNPYSTGGSPTSDYAFCLFFCILVTIVSFFVLDHYEDFLFSLFYNNPPPRGMIRPLVYPLFTRTMVTSIMYLWSRRNPHHNIQINFIPIPGQYLPFAHLGISLMLGNRINEMVHGILVGHVYYYLVEIVPTITGKRVLTTPRILVELLLGGDGDDDDDGGAQEEEDDDQHYQPQAHVGVVPLHERRFGREVATTAHIAAKVGNLDQLYLLSRSAQGRATFGAKDTNGWQPLHEAVRGGYLDVVNFLLGFEDIVDKNAKTYPNNTGTSPLWMAESIHGLDHPVTRRLEAVGAIKIGPETTRPSSSSSPQGNEDVDDDINNEE